MPGRMGCHVTLIRELSAGKCMGHDQQSFNSTYGCLAGNTRRFFVRAGCVGVFDCQLRALGVTADHARTCGDGSADATHECDCRWTLPIVVPLHQPKFAYGCNLFQSISQTESAGANTSLSRLRFVPVFSNQADLELFARRFGEISVTHAMVVEVARGENAAAVKKLRALRRLFDASDPPSHAIALDAESAVNGIQGERAWDYVGNWSKQQGVVVWLHPDHTERSDVVRRTRTACEAVGLPALEGYSWFADWPIFARDDFDDFYSRLSPKYVQSQYKLLEHASYMCYKRFVHNWTAVPVGWNLTRYDRAEDMTASKQDLLRNEGGLIVGGLDAGTSYSFAWARQASDHRLLRFHLDRDFEWPSMVCLRPDVYSINRTNSTNRCCPIGDRKRWRRQTHPKGLAFEWAEADLAYSPQGSQGWPWGRTLS